MHFKHVFKGLALSILLPTFIVGCTGADSTSSTDLTISGSLGGPSGVSSKPSLKVGALAITDYMVRCVTLSATPVAGVGTVNADGSFSLSIAVTESASVPVGCFVVKASDSSVAATFSFDSGSQGIGATGSDTTQSGSVNGGAGEGINFGVISFDADKGTAKVIKANIARSGSSSSATGSWADPSGSWTMTCITSDDYSCPSEAVNNQFPLYLNQVEATDDVSATHKGLAIWQSESTYTSCGSTENLDSILPSGWSAVDTNMNDDYSFDALPAASSLDAEAWDGSKGHCGHTVVPGTTKCSDITNVDDWDFGGGILSDADCQALCQVDQARESNGTCTARMVQNHSVLNGVSPGGIATEVASLSGGSTTLDFLVQENKPRGRHVMGELSIEGSVGTVLDTNSRTEHFCQDNGDGSGCTDRTCTITENVRVTMKQTSSSAAVIEVVITNAMDSSSDSQCFTSVSGNHLADEANRAEKFLLNAVKN